MKITSERIIKLNNFINHGLVAGLGIQEPGKMCVEAAVCAAFDLPHSDNPPCVNSAVRIFKIKLNDCEWSSNMARANGLRKLAIVQLGSDKINSIEFTTKLAIKTVNTLLYAFVNELKYPSAIINACKNANTLKAVADAADAVADAADAAVAAADAAYAAVADAAAYAAVADAADAAVAAADAAYAVAADAAYAAAVAAATVKYANTDKYLILSANIATDILIEMKTEGSKFLHLLEYK